MDSSRSIGIIVPAGVIWCECQRNQEESVMNATTVAVDLAKNVYQLAVADASWRVIDVLNDLSEAFTHAPSFEA
jgi:hypothetical protein